MQVLDGEIVERIQGYDGDVERGPYQLLKKCRVVLQEIVDERFVLVRRQSVLEAGWVVKIEPHSHGIGARMGQVA